MPTTFNRKPHLPIEWAALVLQLVALLTSIGLSVYLLTGRLRHKRMQKTLLILCVVGIIFMTISLVNHYFVQSQILDIFVRVLGSSTILLIGMGHMEILKLLSVLTGYWTHEKVLRLQIYTVTFYYLSHLLFYIEPFFGIYATIPPQGYLTVSYTLFSITFFMLVVFCTVNDIYLSYKVYKDAQLSRTICNGDPVQEEQEIIELSRKYRLLCFSFFIVAPTDALACISYIVALWIGKSDPAFAYALQRISVSNMMFHSIALTNVFLRIRDIKFSKPIDSEPDQHNETAPETMNTRDMIKHYFSFDRNKISAIFGFQSDFDSKESE
jgi:hypothetical protein